MRKAIKVLAVMMIVVFLSTQMGYASGFSNFIKKSVYQDKFCPAGRFLKKSLY